jgi:hypothetical protein
MDKVTIFDPHEIEKFCPISFSAMVFIEKIIEVLGKKEFKKPRPMKFTFTVFEDDGQIGVTNMCLTFEEDHKMAKDKWIQGARKEMERKGTVGSFTRMAKKSGGVKKGGGIKEEFIDKELKSKNPVARKKAQFAKNMRGIKK